MLAALFPILQNANALTVFEHEARDVQRLSRRVLTARRVRTAIDVAAGVTAEVFERRDLLSEMRLRCWRQYVPFPQG